MADIDMTTRDLISSLSSRVIRDEPALELLDRYYDGRQRLQVFGRAQDVRQDEGHVVGAGLVSVHECYVMCSV